MKKIFYIIDNNGEFYSPDRTKRYKALTGQALYVYLRSEEGRGKYFDVWKDDDREVMIGVEIPIEVLVAHRKETHRREYLQKVIRELDISHTSLDIITDMENGSINGEQILSSLSVDFEEEIIEKIEKEELFTAISKLDNDEIEIIRELFYNDKTERYLAKKYGVSQVAIHKRKQRILEKLNKFLKKN